MTKRKKNLIEDNAYASSLAIMTSTFLVSSYYFKIFEKYFLKYLITHVGTN